MKILFLSDLHLGSPLFKSHAEVLNLLYEDYDKIFITGDLVDIWEDDLSKIVSKDSVIINRINELTNVVIVKGNHDPSVIELESVFPGKEICYEYGANIGGKKAMITHGDEFDNLIRKYSWLAKILFPIHWCLERIGVNAKWFFRELYYSVSVKINKTYYNDLVLNVEKELANKYRTDFHYLIVGHTHFPKITSENDFKYINCGDWTDHKSYVEYVDDTFRLVEL